MIYEYLCLNGHKKDKYEHSALDKGCDTMICQTCGHTMGPIPAFGKGIAFFEEGRPRTIYNLGDKPITITSYKQHKEAMKKAGVVEAGVNPRARIAEKGRWV